MLYKMVLVKPHGRSLHVLGGACAVNVASSLDFKLPTLVAYITAMLLGNVGASVAPCITWGWELQLQQPPALPGPSNLKYGAIRACA